MDSSSGLAVNWPLAKHPGGLRYGTHQSFGRNLVVDPMTLHLSGGWLQPVSEIFVTPTDVIPAGVIPTDVILTGGIE